MQFKAKKDFKLGENYEVKQGQVLNVDLLDANKKGVTMAITKDKLPFNTPNPRYYANQDDVKTLSENVEAINP